jgi:hypothetical protein
MPPAAPDARRTTPATYSVVSVPGVFASACPSALVPTSVSTVRRFADEDGIVLQHAARLVRRRAARDDDRLTGRTDAAVQLDEVILLRGQVSACGERPSLEESFNSHVCAP